MTLENVKVGDWVVDGGRFRSTCRRVTKVTAKRVWCDSSQYDRSTGRRIGGGGYIRPATDKEVEEHMANEERTARLHAAMREREAQEDYRLASRFASTETDKWLQLGIDKLETIRKWLDNEEHDVPRTCYLSKAEAIMSKLEQESDGV
jgi:hypothetical protein